MWRVSGRVYLYRLYLFVSTTILVINLTVLPFYINPYRVSSFVRKYNRWLPIRQIYCLFLENIPTIAISKYNYPKSDI